MRAATMLAALTLLASACTTSDGEADVADNPASATSTSTLPTTTTSTTTTTTVPTTTTSQVPRRAVSPDDPLRVTVFGDSVTYDAEPAIVAVLESTGAATVATTAIGGIGLAQLPDAATHFDEVIVGKTDPDVVVMMIGGWDFAAAITNPTGYRQLIDDTLTVLDRAEVDVVWLTMPPTPAREGHDSRRTVVNTIYRSAAAAWPELVSLIETTPILGGPGGEYRRFLPGTEGEPEQLRKVRDGVDDGHLCPAGARRLAEAVHAELRTHFELPPVEPGWVDGPWADEPRYDDPIGACSAVD